MFSIEESSFPSQESSFPSQESSFPNQESSFLHLKNSYAGSGGVGYAAADGSGVAVLMHEQPPAMHKMAVQLAGAAAARL